MTDAAAELCALVARMMGRDHVELDERLIEDLAMESLDMLRIAAAIEEAYGVDIPDADLFEVSRVSDIVGLLAGPGRPAS